MEEKGKSISICSIVVERNTPLEYLLVQSGREAYKGKWGLPGGHVDLLEGPRRAVIREGFEETGYIIAPVGIIGVYTHLTPNGNWITNLAYKGKKIDGDKRKKFDDEIMDVRWFKFPKIMEMLGNQELRFNDTVDILTDLATRNVISLDYHKITT